MRRITSGGDSRSMEPNAGVRCIRGLAIVGVSMKGNDRVRKLLTALVAAAFLTSCGTILYPERHGQRGDRIDPAVLILDGLLLFFFVIPGVVAYAIDFYTGAVYLTNRRGEVSVLQVDPGQLGDATIEALLRELTGKSIRLDDERLQRFQLPRGTDPVAALEEIRDASFRIPPRLAARVGSAAPGAG